MSPALTTEKDRLQLVKKHIPRKGDTNSKYLLYFRTRVSEYI